MREDDALTLRQIVEVRIIELEQQPPLRPITIMYIFHSQSTAFNHSVGSSFCAMRSNSVLTSSWCSIDTLF
jgi:hypothetical protein